MEFSILGLNTVKVFVFLIRCRLEANSRTDMLKKNLIALTILLSVSCLLIATLVYPGASEVDKSSIGFDWVSNYISNLFMAKALNGVDSSSRLWAIPGMFFLAVSFGLFYYDFSKKIISKAAKNMIRYAGISSMVFGFLAVTPYHNLMITIADVLSLVSIFYITVFVFKTKLNFHKILCCICLLDLYFLTYIYYSGTLLNILPVMQKVNFVVTIIWMLSLQYFTTTDDFKQTIPTQ